MIEEQNDKKPRGLSVLTLSLFLFFCIIVSMTRKINFNWNTSAALNIGEKVSGLLKHLQQTGHLSRVQQKAAETAARVEMNKKEDVEFVDGVIFKTAAARAEYNQYKRLRKEAKHTHLYDAEYVAYAEYKARTAAYAEYMKQYFHSLV